MNRIVGWVLAVGLLILGVSVCLSPQATYTKMDDCATSEVIYADGVTAYTPDANFGSIDRGDIAVVHLSLPTDRRIPDAHLCFNAYNCAITASYDGQVLYASGAEQMEDGSMIGAVCPNIAIPDDAWGGTVDIILIPVERAATSGIPEFDLYPADSAYRFFLEHNLMNLIVSVVGLFLSILAVAFLLVRGRWDQVARGAVCASLSTFVMSLWIFSATWSYNLLIDSYAWRQVEYLTIFIIPLPILAYMLNGERKQHYRKILVVLIGVASAYLIIATVLHVANRFHYCETLPGAHIIDLTVAIVVFVMLVRRLRSGNEPGTRYLVMGVIALIGFALFDLVRFYLIRYVPVLDGMSIPSILYIGVIIFLVCLVNSFSTDLLSGNLKSDKLEYELRELEKSEAEQRLMAGLASRYFSKYEIAQHRSKYYFDSVSIFGMGTVCEDVPECHIAAGLVAEDSVEVYRAFYDSLNRLEIPGETVVCVHPHAGRESVWLSLRSNISLDERESRSFAIVSMEDITEARERETAFDMYRRQLRSKPQDKIDYFEANLTHDSIGYTMGDRTFECLDDDDRSWNGTLRRFCATHVHPDERQRAFNLLNREHLIELNRAGQPQLEFYYRGLPIEPTNETVWARVTLNMLIDRYSEDVHAYFLSEAVEGSKATELELQNSVKRLEKELENSRVKIMVNQMQPHFLYNALSAIRTITKTDPDYAYDLLYDFTNHLRATVRALSSDDLIPFPEELKNIKAYLNIEKMRFGDRLKVIYDIEDENFKVVPLSIQPIAENAARHGIYPRGKVGGTVRVHTYSTDTAHIVEVSDDGVGFDLDEVLNSRGDNVGLRSLIFRLDSLMDAKVDIDSVVGKGTTVVVTIPFANSTPNGAQTDDAGADTQDTGKAGSADEDDSGR